jgi:hypothetical protein
MPLQPLTTVDTRAMFRPVSAGLVAVLRGISPEDWLRPTVAGSWVVRDIVAHVLDVTLRRLSFHRDGMPPPPPSRPINSESDFVAFINGINAQWVTASKRLSPRVLTDAFERAGAELADWFEAQPLDGPALFGVSWAGEQASENWFDITGGFRQRWGRVSWSTSPVLPVDGGRWCATRIDGHCPAASPPPKARGSDWIRTPRGSCCSTRSRSPKRRAPRQSPVPARSPGPCWSRDR